MCSNRGVNTTPLTVVSPDGTARGGVIVIQEAFGVTDHIVDVCNRVAAAGWVAVAPHLFHRQEGVSVLDYSDMDSAMAAIGKLEADEVDSDVDAAASALAELAVRENWKIEEFRTEEGRLDEVFRSLTLSDTAHHKAQLAEAQS